MENFILCQDLNNTENKTKVDNFVFQETAKAITRSYYPDQYLIQTNTEILSDTTSREEIAQFLFAYLNNNREITEAVKTLSKTLGIVIKSRDATALTLEIIYNLVEYTVYFDDSPLPYANYVIFESTNGYLRLDLIGQAKLNQLSIPLRETDFYRYQDANKVVYFLIFYLAGLTLTEEAKLAAIRAYLKETYPDTYAKDFPLLFIDDSHYVSHYIGLIDTNDVVFSFSEYMTAIVDRGLNEKNVTLKWNYLTKHNMLIDLILDTLIDGLSTAEMTTFFTLMQSIENYLLYRKLFSDSEIATYSIKYINEQSIRFTFSNFGNIIVSL